MARLARHEQETIINFNEAEKEAAVFTYNKRWQQHFEKKLKVTPSVNNGLGGKEYVIDKKRIPLPRVPRKLSPEARVKLVERGKALSRKSILRSKSITATRKSNKGNSNKSSAITGKKRTANTGNIGIGNLHQHQVRCYRCKFAGPKGGAVLLCTLTKKLTLPGYTCPSGERREES